MDYLLTWIEGEEVGYRFIPKKNLKDVIIEDDKPCTLTEIRFGKVMDIKSFLAKNKSPKKKTLL